MKILREGTLTVEKPTAYRGECRRCHCQVEITEADLAETIVIGEKAVACPTKDCGCYIIVKGVAGRGASGD